MPDDSFTAVGLRIVDVLEAAGVRTYGEQGPDWVKVFCLWHDNKRTPAAEVNINNGGFYCFSCGRVASLLEVVMLATGKSHFAAYRFMNKFKIGNDYTFIDQRPKEPEFVPYDPDTIRRLELGHTHESMEYLSSRGITKQSVVDYHIGYSLKMHMVTFPYFDPACRFIVGFQGRSIEGKDFKNTHGGHKGRTLFGLHLSRMSHEVFVFESPIDSILARQDGIATVATMGDGTSKAQVELLARTFKYVTVVRDNDEAGDKSSVKTLEKLQNAGGYGTIVSPPSGYKDIGDMPKHERQTFIKGLENVWEL